MTWPSRCLLLASRQLSLPGMEDILLIGEQDWMSAWWRCRALSMVMAAHAAGAPAGDPAPQAAPAGRVGRSAA